MKIFTWNVNSIRIRKKQLIKLILEENPDVICLQETKTTNNDFPKIEDNYQQIFSPQTAYQITSLLQGAVERGTGKKLKKLGLNLAGKTGTTNSNQDAWFVGFSSDIVVGVFVGFDNPATLGKRETGYFVRTIVHPPAFFP